MTDIGRGLALPIAPDGAGRAFESRLADFWGGETIMRASLAPAWQAEIGRPPLAGLVR